ncbi:MAG: lipoprotein [Ottowia sp.]
MKQHTNILLIPLIRPINRIFAACAAVGLAGALAGCGQRGPLYLPDTPAARQRATLPETLWPAGHEAAEPAAEPAAESAAEPARPALLQSDFSAP